MNLEAERKLGPYEMGEPIGTGDERRAEIRVVLGWSTELERLVPTQLTMPLHTRARYRSGLRVTPR